MTHPIRNVRLDINPYWGLGPMNGPNRHIFHDFGSLKPNEMEKVDAAVLFDKGFHPDKKGGASCTYCLDIGLTLGWDGPYIYASTSLYKWTPEQTTVDNLNREINKLIKKANEKIAGIHEMTRNLVLTKGD